MAITNASDLLVYAKTTLAAAQITRIRVLTADPIEVPDGGTTGTLKINNITNSSGVVYDDISTAASTNTGSAVLTAISNVLSSSYNYNASAEQTEGDYKYRDFTNGASGIVPTLEIVNGTASINQGAVIISIETPGSSAIFDPVAYSTSASFTTNVDLRDITTKDSGGFSESKAGLKSFEISTELLQSVNPDVPIDGTDLFHELSERDQVNVSFSDRIRNIIRTNLTQSGVDGFGKSDDTFIEQTNLQTDAFGNLTGSKLKIIQGGTFKNLNYSLNSSRVQGKYVTWTFYVKGDPDSPNNNEATFFSKTGTSDNAFYSFEIISGDGSITGSSTIKTISGLNTNANNVQSNWTRVRVTYKFEGDQTATTAFALSPGDGNSQVSGDVIYTSSWQIEFSPEETDYQDPIDITHWQGNALVTSVNFDAGVEDNLTCSATFTGTGNVNINGLGPELIQDTEFNDPSYWDFTGGTTIVEDGYGKIQTTGAYAAISKTGITTSGDRYLLTYSVHTNTQGGIALGDVEDSIDVNLPSTASQTYNVQFKANSADLIIKRIGATTIWLSSISLKKVL